MTVRRAICSLVFLFCSASYGESVPLILDHGTFLVPVLVNDKITLNFTVDSGASDVSIPADVFSTLIRTGTIAKTDLLEPRTYELADGSARVERRFRIKTLKVGNVELHDVRASVAPAEGSLLLGQSFLYRMKSWSMDNERHRLVFNESPDQHSEPIAPKTNSPMAATTVATQSGALDQTDDSALLKAVTFALTGDDGARVDHLYQCVYQVRSGSPSRVWTFHLENIDPERLRVGDSVVTSGTDVHISGESTVVDEYGIDPNIPTGTMGGNMVLSHHTQWTLKTATGESDRVSRTWSYIFSHGCGGHKSSF